MSLLKVTEKIKRVNQGIQPKNLPLSWECYHNSDSYKTISKMS